MKVAVAKPEHEIAYQDIVALLRRHEHLTPLEMLAIAANAVGKMIAMQDQRVVTPDMALAVVGKNIEAGNRQVIAELAATKGSG
jgi:hypothetical protein